MGARGSRDQPVLRYALLAVLLHAVLGYAWYVQRQRANESLPIVRFGSVAQAPAPASRASDSPALIASPLPPVPQARAAAPASSTTSSPATDQAAPRRGTSEPAVAGEPSPLRSAPLAGNEQRAPDVPQTGSLPLAGDASPSGLFRPEAPEARVPEEAMAPKAREESAPLTRQAIPRMVIHHQAGDQAATKRAAALARTLGSGRDIRVEVRSVPMNVPQDNIRIFFPADREEAARVRDIIDREAIPIRDFSHYRPLPRPGTIEVWLAG